MPKRSGAGAGSTTVRSTSSVASFLFMSNSIAGPSLCTVVTIRQDKKTPTIVCGPSKDQRVRGKAELNIDGISYNIHIYPHRRAGGGGLQPTRERDWVGGL